MAKITKSTATTKVLAHSFLNWEVLDKAGNTTGIKGSQAMRTNEYTSPGEAWLMKQLDERGGEEFTITLKAVIRKGGKAEIQMSSEGII